MKSKNIIIVLILVVLTTAGCARQPQDNKSNNTGKQNPSETTPDVVTTASIVNTEAAFEKAISNTGVWIICTLKDLSFSKELVLDGEFKNGKKDENGKDIIQRKIALYTQGEDRSVTDRFKLKAPKLTINSPKARIQSGTFIGDIYVNAKDFELVDTKVEGNVYFSNQDTKNTFKMDEKSSITGKQELSK